MLLSCKHFGNFYIWTAKFFFLSHTKMKGAGLTTGGNYYYNICVSRWCLTWGDGLHRARIKRRSEEIWRSRAAPFPAGFPGHLAVGCNRLLLKASSFSYWSSSHRLPTKAGRLDSREKTRRPERTSRPRKPCLPEDIAGHSASILATRNFRPPDTAEEERNDPANSIAAQTIAFHRA